MFVTDECIEMALDAMFLDESDGYTYRVRDLICVRDGRFEIDVMRAALTAALASMWRPIEEARGVVVSCYSKDSYGPRIIAYPGRGGGVVTARWWQHTDGTCNFLDDGGNAIYPNVFMPLPAPPVQQKEGV